MAMWWVEVVLGSRKVVFKAASSVTKALPPSSVQRFQDFLALESTPSTVISLNSGIRRTEVLSTEPHRHRGYLIPLVFPGMKIENTVDFSIRHVPGSRLEVRLDENGALRQEYQGAKFLADLCAGLLPAVSSSNVLALQCDSTPAMLTNSADIVTTFDVPDHFSIPARIIENRGSAAIQMGMNRDLDGLVDGVIAAFLMWDAQQQQ